MCSFIDYTFMTTWNVRGVCWPLTSTLWYLLKVLLQFHIDDRGNIPPWAVEQEILMLSCQLVDMMLGVSQTIRRVSETLWEHGGGKNWPGKTTGDTNFNQFGTHNCIKKLSQLLLLPNSIGWMGSVMSFSGKYMMESCDVLNIKDIRRLKGSFGFAGKWDCCRGAKSKVCVVGLDMVWAYYPSRLAVWTTHSTLHLCPALQSPSVFIKHLSKALVFLPTCDCVS